MIIRNSDMQGRSKSSKTGILKCGNMVLYILILKELPHEKSPVHRHFKKYSSSPAFSVNNYRGNWRNLPQKMKQLIP